MVCLLHTPVPTMVEVRGHGRIAVGAPPAPGFSGGGPSCFGLTCWPALSGGSRCTTVPTGCLFVASRAREFFRTVAKVLLGSLRMCPRFSWGPLLFFFSFYRCTFHFTG